MDALRLTTNQAVLSPGGSYYQVCLFPNSPLKSPLSRDEFTCCTSHGCYQPFSQISSSTMTSPSLVPVSRTSYLEERLQCSSPSDSNLRSPSSSGSAFVSASESFSSAWRSWFLVGTSAECMSSLVSGNSTSVNRLHCCRNTNFTQFGVPSASNSAGKVRKSGRATFWRGFQTSGRGHLKNGMSSAAVAGSSEIRDIPTFDAVSSIVTDGGSQGVADVITGPYCVYVGPIEEAEKSQLEALYQQARDEYYDGHPLILDEMFDKVERRLRWFKSKLVQKYPRCSLRRYSAYADAELDQSQLTALASIWALLLAGGGILVAAPPVGLALQLCQPSLALSPSPSLYHPLHPALFHPGLPMALNGGLLGSLSMLLGAAVATAAVRSLQGLWKGDVLALKGACPACGEEVYAFIRADESSRPRHKCECHVCEKPLVFHATLEESQGHIWAYGRIYLVVRASDLSPGSDAL